MSRFSFQTILRAKDNEVQYLQKEISCLQNEVQSLTKVRFMICDLYYLKITLYMLYLYTLDFPVLSNLYFRRKKQLMSVTSWRM